MNGSNEYAYLYVAGSEGPYVGWLHGNKAYKGRWRGMVVVIVGAVEQA